MKGSEGSSTETWRPASPASCIARRPERFALTGPSRRPDPRIHAYRTDVADVLLANCVFAPHYARAEPCFCTVSSVMIRATPSDEAPAVSQLLHGEGFAVLDVSGGWAWGRCLHDDYVGYIPDKALGTDPDATHCVIAARAPVFARADIKSPVVASWSLGSRLAGEAEGAFVRTGRGFVHGRHVAKLEPVAADWVDVAERLLGQPYLWGGRGDGGIDCSGLVQLALGRCGIAAPRDSDLQRTLGVELPAGAALLRGDLVFLPGHVGMMADETHLLHANAHWMAVTTEPLDDVLARLGPDVAVERRRLIG